jgi:glucosamine-6-phosphate deaminase
MGGAFQENMVAVEPLQTRKVDRLTIEVYADEAAVVSAVADRFQRATAAAIAASRRARVIFASGSSQIRLLATLTGNAGIDWQRIQGFHLDEYLGIDRRHPASFHRYMQEKIFDIVPIDFSPILGDCLEPLAECDRYTSLLNTDEIDFCFLGIGDNGHIAFNDPLVANFADSHAVKLIKLAEKSREQQVTTGFFTNLADVPQYAFTLTIPAIFRSHEIACIACGDRKANIVWRLSTEPISPDCPATILRDRPGCTLYLDEAAAAKI